MIDGRFELASRFLHDVPGRVVAVHVQVWYVDDTGELRERLLPSAWFNPEPLNEEEKAAVLRGERTD